MRGSKVVWNPQTCQTFPNCSVRRSCLLNDQDRSVPTLENATHFPWVRRQAPGATSLLTRTCLDINTELKVNAVEIESRLLTICLMGDINLATWAGKYATEHRCNARWKSGIDPQSKRTDLGINHWPKPWVVFGWSTKCTDCFGLFCNLKYPGVSAWNESKENEDQCKWHSKKFWETSACSMLRRIMSVRNACIDQRTGRRNYITQGLKPNRVLVQRSFCEPMVVIFFNAGQTSTGKVFKSLSQKSRDW